MNRWLIIVTLLTVGSAVQLFGQTTEDFSAYVREAEKFLYDPNSPLRDEDAFREIALQAAQSLDFSPEQRARYAEIARLCALNARGTIAADFAFCGIDGVERTLYSVDADYTLLFFTNPGCKACGQIVEILKNPIIEMLISTQVLAIVNVYIDEDLAAWKEHLGDYPSSWYNCFDPYGVLRSDEIYNIRAIPSLYLLDCDKEVLVKDAPIEKILQLL